MTAIHLLLTLLMIAIVIAIGFAIFGLFAAIGGPVVGGIALALWLFRSPSRR